MGAMAKETLYTDGEIRVATLVGRGNKAVEAAKMLPAPALIQVKDAAFSWASPRH